jgi:hypothetical protein
MTSRSAGNCPLSTRSCSRNQPDTGDRPRHHFVGERAGDIGIVPQGVGKSAENRCAARRDERQSRRETPQFRAGRLDMRRHRFSLTAGVCPVETWRLAGDPDVDPETRRGRPIPDSYRPFPATRPVSV